MNNIFILVFTLFATVSFVAAQTPTPTPDPLAAAHQRADRLQARLNDFANFARYRDMNSKLPSPTKDEQRVVFMGDSITDVWKLDQYFPGAPYVNRGISGQTTPQMLLRFRSDVIDLQPKVVVILAGTNDIAGNTGPMSLMDIENNYQSMVELAHVHGIHVVFASIMPISDYNKNAQGNPIIRSTQRRPEQILALNEWIKKYCAEKKLVYLDYFTAMADEKGFLKADLANDGLHPNPKGYELIKPLAENAIKTALKMKRPK